MFLGASITTYVASALALGELVTDKLPMTPSRKIPMQFGARILSGALCGAAIATPGGAILLGLFLATVGGIIGTFAGAAMRTGWRKLSAKIRSGWEPSPELGTSRHLLSASARSIGSDLALPAC